MAVSDKFSCLCSKCPKQKLALSEGFVNYLQIELHNYQELLNLEIARIQLITCIENTLT